LGDGVNKGLIDQTTERQQTEITLGVLDAVNQNAKITQRSISGELGIALGLANAYLKRCVRKGWIKVKQIPPNRYLYYLTPKGFAEKTRLSAEYLTSSFSFFRRARAELDAALGACRARGWQRVALFGRSDLTEIAALCNAEHRLDLVVIAADAAERPRAAGLPAAATLAEAGAIDAAIITELAEPQRAYDTLALTVPRERIVAPGMLRIARAEAAAGGVPA
jgi:DNA-binding MarR family transcriptional regulator